MRIKKTKEAVALAIQHFGTKYKLAKACGVAQSTAGKWERNGTVSPLSALRIEVETCGAVTKEQLRPDIFGAAS